MLELGGVFFPGDLAYIGSGSITRSLKGKL
jgi:hypothetical protein